MIASVNSPAVNRGSTGSHVMWADVLGVVSAVEVGWMAMGTSCSVSAWQTAPAGLRQRGQSPEQNDEPDGGSASRIMEIGDRDQGEVPGGPGMRADSCCCVPDEPVDEERQGPQQPSEAERQEWDDKQDPRNHSSPGVGP
jgi:hypothetical protein